MAQPSYAIKYLGSMRVEPNVAYTSASILTAYPSATVIKAKFDNSNDDVSVSIDSSPMFKFTNNEECYIESGQSFVFSKAFTIAVGQYKAVV